MKNEFIDDIARKYTGMGGIEDYRSFARDIAAAERKADERQRYTKAGRVSVTVHVLPQYRPEVRALEAKLRRRERKKTPNVELTGDRNAAKRHVGRPG